MAPQQKTRAYLEIQYGLSEPWLIDEIKEFRYVSDMMSVGDTCTFTVVADGAGETLRRLPVGALCKLRLNNPAVNGGRWTLKHLGRIVEREADLRANTISLTSADLGWHLTTCHAPTWAQLRGLSLGQVVTPGRGFVDKSFGLQGVRADQNRLNRALKQGRAVAQAQQLKVLTPILAIQAEPGEAFWDVITRYAQRENLLCGVTVDGYVQLWSPDYERAAVYSFEVSDARSNCTDARRWDSAATRYTEVTVVGEALQLGVQLNDPTNPNATKRRGYYRAPGLLPYTHRLTAADAEMLDGKMAAAQAEWRWKRGLHDSHYLTVKVPDHYQIGADGRGVWLESDELADCYFPGLSTRGRYYVQSVVCDSTVRDGDTSTLVLRWPYLLSASYGVWGTRPQLGDPADTLALLPGIGGAE